VHRGAHGLRAAISLSLTKKGSGAGAGVGRPLGPFIKAATFLLWTKDQWDALVLGLDRSRLGLKLALF